MELLYIVNVLLGFIGAVGILAVTNLYTQLREMKNEMSKLHEVYAKKDDVREEFHFIRNALQRIEAKLDSKMDR